MTHQLSSPYKMVGVLVAVCVVAAGGLSLTYAVTKDRIIEEKKKDEAKAYTAALPKVTNANGFVPMKGVTDKATKKYPGVIKVVKAQVGDRLEGYIVVAGPRGYGGPVRMAVGLTPAGKVTGIALIALGNNETPGLGTKAFVPAFIKQFIGKSASDPLEIGKDIDGITGATRSAKAVTDGAKTATMVYKDYLRSQ